MNVQFSDLLSKNGRKKEIKLCDKFHPIDFEGEIIKIIDNVLVDGFVTAMDDILVLTASIKTNLELQCSRCLDTFIYPIDIDIEERFTNNKDLLSEEVIFVEGDYLDITEIIENSIISTLPIKRLCATDCKGLCSVCGVNNNKQFCNCNDYDIDIRFAKLGELFGK